MKLIIHSILLDHPFQIRLHRIRHSTRYLMIHQGEEFDRLLLSLQHQEKIVTPG